MLDIRVYKLEAEHKKTDRTLQSVFFLTTDNHQPTTNLFSLSV